MEREEDCSVTSNDAGKAAAPRIPTRYPLLLALACALGSMMTIPFLVESQRINTQPDTTVTWSAKDFAFVIHERERQILWGPAELLGEAFPNILLSAVAIYLGLKLGPRVGLAWPPIISHPGTSSPARGVMMTLLLALGLGIGVGVADIVLDTISSRLIVIDQPGLSEPPWFLGLMGSTGAGIVEETCFRLGVMSTVVWLVAKLLGKNKASPAVIWSVIILAGVLFGAAHIPRLMGLVPDATKLMMLLVVLGNLINGAAFGWLFWRKGLIAAITAHVTQDILTHVILPLLA